MTWCKDIARDEAVRAAEDKRTAPLPTLEEAIVLAFGFDKASAQRACDELKSWPEDVQKDCRFVLGDSLEQGVERLQALVEAWRWGKGLLAARYPAMFPKSGSASSKVDHENKGDSMATKSEIQAADYRAEAIARPFAEAAKRSPAVSEMGGTQSGIRTERVTLECVHRFGKPPREWDWWRLMELRPGESVRVVDEAHFDDLAQVAMEREAAIRERDELKARVAALDARTSTAGEVSRDAPAASGGGEQPRGWLTEDQKDAISTAREHLSLGLIGTDENSGWYKVHKRRVAALNDLLARSSPPEVVLPKLHTRCEVNEANHKSPCLWFSRPEVIAALAAAGVAVKEVRQ
jgi:hypothetical protein